MKFSRFAMVLLPLFSVLAGADYEDLDDEADGRMLYVQHTGELCIFRGRSGRGRWKCSPFGSSRVVPLLPKILEVLPFRHDSDPFSVSMHVIHRIATEPENREVYLNIARRIPSERHEDLRGFMAELDGLLVELHKKYDELNALHASRRPKNVFGRPSLLTRPSNSCRTPSMPAPSPQARDKGDDDEIIDAIIELIGKEGQPVKRLEKFLTEHDFYLLTAMAFTYFREIRRSLPRNRAELAKQVETELRAQETLIVSTFKAARGSGSAREREFRALFPNARSGAWNMGAPVNIDQMYDLFNRSYAAFKTGDGYSKHSNFSRWGDAMLDILLLMPGCKTGEKLERDFDDAMRRYRARTGK